VTAGLQQALNELEQQLGESIEIAAKRCGLDTDRGPRRATRIPAEPRTAWDLACRQAREQLPIIVAELREFQTHGLNGLGRKNWSLDLTDPQLDAAAASLGVPLLGAVSPAAMHALTRLRLLTRVNIERDERAQLLATLSELVLEETQLWLPHRIPYAFRRRMLEWLHEPESHEHRLAYTVCIRCGYAWQSTGDRRHRQANSEGEISFTPPRCAHCTKETPAQRDWPADAIAPAGRGKWWLRCDRGDSVFEGQRNAKHCPRHRTAATTPRRRQSQADRRSASS
jgi:hypothetical protein